jgi:predicted nuclease with TOPRIM domain
MALTKRELEDINEELQLEIGRLRAENARLASTLASATAQYAELSERTERLERRYARLKDLLIASLGESLSESATVG